MEETKSQEQQSQNEYIPLNYYLFSVTMLIDGKRVYRDIPLYSHKLVFPKRADVFTIACQFFRIEEPESYDDLWNSFAVLNVYKFNCKEDYLSYIGELNVG